MTFFLCLNSPSFFQGEKTPFRWTTTIKQVHTGVISPRRQCFWNTFSLYIQPRLTGYQIVQFFSNVVITISDHLFANFKTEFESYEMKAESLEVHYSYPPLNFWINFLQTFLSPFWDTHTFFCSTLLPTLESLFQQSFINVRRGQRLLWNIPGLLSGFLSNYEVFYFSFYRVNSVNHCLSILQKFVDLYQDLPASFEIFSPVKEHLQR